MQILLFFVIVLDYEEDWLIENDIPSDLVDAYGEYLILRKSNLNDSKLNRMHKNFICICLPNKCKFKLKGNIHSKMDLLNS